MLRLIGLLFVCNLFFNFFAQVDAKNVRLLDHWTTDSLLSIYDIRFNEVWYFERENREYALIGSTEGTHFFEITTDDKLRFIQFVPGRHQSMVVHNRDFRDFGNYVYAVADQGATSSLQIIDISNLPESVYVAAEDSINWNLVHTLCIDKDAELLYACSFTPPLGSDFVPAALKVFSLENPLNPSLVFSGFPGIPEVHYAYVRNGIAFLNCGFNGLRIYNFSNPSAPVLLGSISVYNDQGYNHSGWLSEDGNTYFFTDETLGKRIKMVDVSDISNPMIQRTFGVRNYEDYIAHHIVPVGDLLFVAYYNQGLRIFDTRVPIREVAHYDTYPLQSNFKMNGAWGVYPFRGGNRILVSDRTFGLFLLGFDYDVFQTEFKNDNFLMYPNPIMPGQTITVFIEDRQVNELKIDVFDQTGKLVYEQDFAQQSYAQFQLDLAKGLYYVRASYLDFLGREEIKHGKLVLN